MALHRPATDLPQTALVPLVLEKQLHDLLPNQPQMTSSAQTEARNGYQVSWEVPKKKMLP